MPLEQIVKFFANLGIHCVESGSGLKVYSVHLIGHVMYYPTTGRLVQSGVTDEKGLLTGIEKISVADLANKLAMK